MSKTFPQESSDAFLNLKSLHYAEQKNFTSMFQQSALKSTSKKNIGLFGFSKKKLFGTLPPLLNKTMGFITELLEKQFKDSP